MQLVAIDVGTGTQDIVVWDTEQTVENALQLVLPSPTLQVSRTVREATRLRQPLILDGVLMGGGPCHWAVTDHLKMGLPVYATSSAARTFDDDLEAVQAMGIILCEPDERKHVIDACYVTLADLQWDLIAAALAHFGVVLAPAALGIAVFDHGNAPPGVSDRQFRFDYLAARLQGGGWLTDLAFPRASIPSEMTRLRALAATAPGDIPLLVMDTAPAAVLGALEDPHVAGASEAVIANIGNFHALAFHVAGRKIRGLFEHHTGELTPAALAALLTKLATGTLTHAEVFGSQGHGALIFEPAPASEPLLATTGPRQNMLGAVPAPYRAVPHGAMMQAGNWGLLRAMAAHMPDCRSAIQFGLGS
ncbi:MAG: DUF1786 domain-containing protein [Herpetosiphon sp.]